MSGFSRDLLELWPVAVVALVAPAVPIAFQVANPAFSLAPLAPKSHQRDYPIRFELPPARTPAPDPARPVIEFDLADPGANEGGSAVELRKPVWLIGAEAGAAAGNATIRVGADSTLAVSAGELGALLTRAGRGDLARQINGLGGGYVEFDTLRRLGIDLRFDAAADRIVIAL